MGVLRLLLAIVVLFSHMGYTVYGYNPGVVAVIVFYLMAGQVVARLWCKMPTERRLVWYYRDRALRILPTYYFSLVVVAILWWLGLLHDTYYLTRSPTVFDWFANSALVPMNYFMFNDSDGFALLPTAWSLAVEVQFYLLVPLVLSCRNTFRVLVFFSFLIYISAQLGLVQQDYYGYRLLPGVLWVFLSGTLLAQPSRKYLVTLVFLWISCCIYTTYLLGTNLSLPYLLEVALGYTLGVPLVYFLSRLPIKSLRMQRLQRYSGAYSYPLFLIHLPIIWCVNAMFGPVSWGWLLVLIASLFYAMLIHNFIELPLWRRLRPVLKL